MSAATERSNHYNQWPNTVGFEVVQEELEPRELEVSGDIPAYCAGVLYRNGLGPRDIVTDQDTIVTTNHWFDCTSQVHRFQILAPTPEVPRVRVIHNSRRTCDGLIQRARRTGKRDEITFAAKYDLCQTFFKKVQTFFTPFAKETKDSLSIQVTLSPNMPGISKTGTQQHAPHKAGKIDCLINKTDAITMQALDPETLEPIGMAHQTILHPDLKGMMSGAHAKVCPKTGDIYNFNLDFGRTGWYRAFHVSAETGKCDILAAFPCIASYIHSSYLTENYYIICVWNSHFSAYGASVLWNRNVLDALAEYDQSKKATWFVIDRKPASEGGRGLFATFESNPYFCFHTINAYEEQSPTDPENIDIIADCCAYDNLNVLHHFFLDNLLSDSETAKAYCHRKYDDSRGYYKRFRLPGADNTARTSTATSSSTGNPKQAEVVAFGEKGWAPELPSINHARRCSPYRYVYGVLDTGKSTFFDSLVKYDVKANKPVKTWSEHGQSAGEPIFIADPAADPLDPEQEDHGVLLTAVLDGFKERSYLLVLEARTMTELGRATMVEGPAKVMGFGFHGAYVGEGGVLEGA